MKTKNFDLKRSGKELEWLLSKQESMFFSLSMDVGLFLFHNSHFLLVQELPNTFSNAILRDSKTS
jgi:hypothetical protein